MRSVVRAVQLVLLLLGLAVHGAEIRVSFRTGSMTAFSERGVVRGSDFSWKYEATKPSAEDLAALAAASPASDLYQLRAVIGTRTMTTSVPLCRLKGADFTDHFTLHLDERAIPYHISYRTPASPCLVDALTTPVRFNTTLSLQRTQDGPSAAEQARPKPGEPEKAKSDTPFYMQPMFLIGVAAVMFMSMLGGGGGGGAQGGEAAARR